MTLYIKVTKCQSQCKTGQLYVQGSNSGLLASSKITSQKHEFRPAFYIICSKWDDLCIKLCENKHQYLQDNPIATAQFHIPSFIKKYENKLNLDEEYVMELELQKKQMGQRSGNVNGGVQYHPVFFGTLYAEITYDRVSGYMGEFIQPSRKSQQVKAQPPPKSGQENPKQIVVPKPGGKKKKLELYRGRCPTKNLFSLFDSAAEGQKAKFVESIYRDEYSNLSSQQN